MTEYSTVYRAAGSEEVARDRPIYGTGGASPRLLISGFQVRVLGGSLPKDLQTAGKGEGPERFSGPSVTTFDTTGAVYPRASPIASASPSSIPGSTCEYVSRVMEMVAWPKSTCTSFAWTPLLRRIVAHVCRRSWCSAGLISAKAGRGHTG